MADSNNVDLQAWTDDRFFEAIAQLVMCHSPSGVDHWQDNADNIVVKIRGKGEGVLAITAHKDEIGGIVKRVETGGRLAVRPLGGAFPWVYGEGVVDLLGGFFLRSRPTSTAQSSHLDIFNFCRVFADCADMRNS